MLGQFNYIIIRIIVQKKRFPQSIKEILFLNSNRIYAHFNLKIMKVIGNNLRKKANYVHMTWKKHFFPFFGSEITHISILFQICGLISKKLTETYEKWSFYANKMNFFGIDFIFSSQLTMQPYNTSMYNVHGCDTMKCLLVVLFFVSKLIQ